MPKASPNQTSFSGGEFSPLVQGRVDVERYKTGLDICLNYLPTLQGPLVRRPGTKYIGTVKDPSLPPTLVPFQFSADQSYMLEFGDLYLRFWANEGQVITNTTAFKVTGTDTSTTLFDFKAIRDNPNPGQNEVVTATSVVGVGSVLELVTPYASTDLSSIRYAQKEDTLYLTCPRLGTYKLQRSSNLNWALKRVAFQDGPYLPLNSYSTLGDQLRTTLTPLTIVGGTVYAGPVILCSSAVNNGAGLIRIKSATPHLRSTGDSVVITGVVGTTEANNVTATIPQMSWKVNVIDASTFDLYGSVFTNPYTGSGIIYSALFEPNPFVPGFLDVGRNVAFIQAGRRYWGYVLNVTDMKEAQVVLDSGSFLSATSVMTAWQMGVWRRGVLPPYQNPATVTFHQDRLTFAGTPYRPQQIDLSMSSDYEHFAPSNSSLQVADNNAISLNLLSSESNPLRWVKSSTQGLLAGSGSIEWQIAPNSQSEALTPTNRNATATSFFGSAQIDAVQAGNATLYVQNAYRKVRELNFFFQVGTFRSTDLSELAEHLTAPMVTKLAVQKEPFPLVWATRSDGVLLSMSYNRDDTTIKAGWARHTLGGQSDSGGSIPQVKSIGVISASSATNDQLWMTVQRFINGTSVVSVEVFTAPYNDSMPQADAYCLDMGATYDAPIAVSNITNNGSCVVTAASHGFNNGSSVLFTDVVGLNLKTTDINGNILTSSFVNSHTFIVASTTTNTFYLQDFQGGFISASSYSQYVSGGNVRKLVTTISGLTWLKNETVGIVADGGIHPDVTVASSGVIALSYPAAKVQIGYRYNSDGGTLRSDAGSATGSSMGMTKRITRAAFLLHRVGDFSFGPTFTRLLPSEFPRADQQLADNATCLFSGFTRDGVEGIYDLEDNLVFRQNSGLPGVVQSVTTMMDEIDV